MKIQRVFYDNRGFSLAETMVATGVIVLISTLMLLFIMQGANLWHLVLAQSDIRQYGRNALTIMTTELRNATRTSTESPSPNLTIPSKPNNSSLDFYLPLDQDSNGYIFNLTGSTEWDKSNRIQYQYVPGQKLLRRLEKGVQRVIASDVSDVQFEDNSITGALYNDELKIILTLSKSLPRNRTTSVTLTTIVKLRNR